MRIKTSEWRKVHAGRYVSLLSGWIIERSENARVWNVINPATAQVFDTAKLLRTAKLTYSNIKLNA